MKTPVVENLLNVFEQFRRAPLAIDEYESKGKEILRQKFLKFVQYNRPIKFSLMGFPMKSTNKRDKVLGDLPDLAEQLTMANFKEFERAMTAVYPPGIQITIASDGFAFSDVLGVTDYVVDQYQEISMGMASEVNLRIVNLRDFYGNKPIDSLREKMVSQWGITDVELERRILTDTDVNILYKNMIRFMEQEVSHRQDWPSRNQLQKAAKVVTREMMLRNEAYSRLVQNELSDHIRLSMHPSINNGVKYSFQLIRSPYAMHSAWHSAILVNTDGSIGTIHKADAIKANHELIYQNNQPYYFQAK